MEKLLSVIVPSYNMEAYLPKCLGSLLIDDKELFQALDVIVVNDGSKDRTSEIAHEFEAKYPGVFRVIDKPNGHYGSCVNAALKVAEGRFVKVLDADDYFETGAFQSFLTKLFDCAVELAPDVVFSNYFKVDLKGVRPCVLPYPSYLPFNVRQYVNGSSFTAMHSIAYSTALLRKINYRQTEGIMYTDEEWSIYPMAHATIGFFIPEFVYGYNVNRQGQSMDAVVQRKNDWMRLIIAERLLKESQDVNGPQEVRNFIRANCVRIFSGPFVRFFFFDDFMESNDNIRKHVENIEQNHPVLLSLMPLVKIPQSCSFGFRYLCSWRKNGHWPVLYFRTLRLCQRLWKIIRRYMR